MYSTLVANSSFLSLSHTLRSPSLLASCSWKKEERKRNEYKNYSMTAATMMMMIFFPQWLLSELRILKLIHKEYRHHLKKCLWWGCWLMHLHTTGDGVWWFMTCLSLSLVLIINQTEAKEVAWNEWVSEWEKEKVRVSVKYHILSVCHCFLYSLIAAFFSSKFRSLAL